MDDADIRPIRATMVKMVKTDGTDTIAWVLPSEVERLEQSKRWRRHDKV